MKRILLALSGITLVLSLACKPDRNDNGNANEGALTRADEKTIAIAISDDLAETGKFIIEESVPSRAYLKPGHKVSWCVINNCKSAVVESVVIDYFRYPPTGSPTDTTPFGTGDAADQKFEFTDAIPAGSSDCLRKKSKAAKTISAGQEWAYKYRITVKITGVAYPIVKDPQVVIGN